MRPFWIFSVVERMPYLCIFHHTISLNSTTMNRWAAHLEPSLRCRGCCVIYIGVSGELLRRLQSVQNAAARFITGTRKYDHITPVLRNLHWLPVRQRIIFKIATLMYRCLNGLAPSYLAADCIVVSAIPGRRQLRSATSGQLYIPRTRTVTFGPRSFKVCGPTIWNDLPARMKDPSLSFDSFRKMLKTFLFDK